MQFENDIKRSDQIKTFDDLGKVAGCQLVIPQIVDAAEDDRHSGKELWPGHEGEIEGVVIGNNDDVEMFSGVFLDKYLKEALNHRGGIVSFGIQILDLQVDLIRTVVEACADAVVDRIRPLIPVVIGIQVKNAFL